MSEHKQDTQAWKLLSRYLPPRTASNDFWWQLTGRHLAALVDAAGYTAQQQYEALIFHYHWMVPFMGSAPLEPGTVKHWKSLLQPDGTPIEYSWKWNVSGGQPDIRYDIEPIGDFAGTALDPLNQQAAREMLHRLALAMPEVDLGWSNHFLATLFDHDYTKYTQEAEAGSAPTSSVLVAAELARKGIMFKTYFQGRKLGHAGVLPLQHWESAIDVVVPNNAALAAVHDFVTNNTEGKALNPFSVSVDTVVPSKARLKWYFMSPHTSFSAVREIMTLSGRISRPGLDQQLSEWFSLMKAMMGLPEDFAEDLEMASALPNHEKTNGDAPPPLLPGYAYYFDVGRGHVLPDVKINVPMRQLGRDDLSVAHSIVDWMQARGRGEYGARYMDMLKALAPNGDLEKARGLQSFVACLFKPNGELDITTYLAAQR